MSAFSRFLIGAFVIFAFMPSAIWAGDGDKTRTDLYGDPLPPGAVARLGSVRFRFSSYSPCPLIFSADGKSLLAGDGESLLLWDRATGERIRKFDLNLPCRSVAGFSSGGKVFALVGESSLSEAVFVRPQSKSERMRPPSLGLNVQPLALSPDGNQLLFWRGNELVLWDFAAQKTVKSVSVKDSKSPLGSLLPYSTAALSPNARIVAFIKWKTGEVCLLDPRTLRTLRKWDGPSSPNGAPHLTFSWDGKSLIAGGGFGIRVWDVASGKELRRFAENGPYPWGTLAVSPDGQTVATVDEMHKVIVLWDMATRRHTKPAGDEPGTLNALSYVDGNTLVSVATDAVVRLWDARSGKCLRRARPDKSFGRIVAVSPKASCWPAPRKRIASAFGMSPRTKCSGKARRLSMPRPNWSSLPMARRWWEMLSRGTLHGSLVGTRPRARRSPRSVSAETSSPPMESSPRSAIPTIRATIRFACSALAWTIDGVHSPHRFRSRARSITNCRRIAECCWCSA